MTSKADNFNVTSSYAAPRVIDDGLDRQNIAILRKRFMAVNEDRLERMRGALSDRQQLFMDILPLLFHTNHPMMPGFVSRTAPARVSHFKPTKHDILVGKMVAKSFTIGYDPSAEDEIFGIYIMGSVGTIAQSEGSDLDIWICHRPGITKKRLGELQNKCEKITEWAAQMRLEAHFFLMDHEEFKARKVSALNSESSGSAQHLLLLDEFYRTAIFVAGRMPIWWYVPFHQENDFREYTNTLLHKRFIPNESILDFGGISSIPPGEFLGAGIWQLYKAIESPYKSALKLLLLEAYVADYPNIQPLSMTFKSKLYEGETNIDLLDSYVMIYERIENYLIQKKQFKRLELARRCFYFKVNKPLSKPPSRRAKSWQRILLESLTQNWGWDLETIKFLDSRSQWKAAEVNSERELLVTELNHSYRFLLEFANSSGASRAISSTELLILGRKLQAAYERRPGKIEWINPSISEDIAESIVVISKVEEEGKNASIWTAFSHDAGESFSSGGTAVKSSRNLIELILWCYFNGVIVPTTQVEIDGDSPLQAMELKRLITTFKSWLPLPLTPVAHDTFKRPASPKSVLFLVNAGSSPTPDLDKRGYQRMSDKSDALRYGGFEENLVASVDMVIRNNWNEVSIRRFENTDALIDAASEYLQLTLPGTHQRPPSVNVVCVGNSHATIISHRIENWLKEITQCFFAGSLSKHRRFIFQMADSFYCMQYKGMMPQIKRFRARNHLIDHLEMEQENYSPIVLDSNALMGHPLKSIVKHSHSGAIDVFYRRFDIGIEVFVVDERGSILHSMFRGRRNHNPLKPLYQFLRSVLYRQAQLDPELAGDFGIFPINFIELTKEPSGLFSARPRGIIPEIPEAAKFEVKAVARLNQDQELTYDFYCDEQEFSGQSINSQLELVVCQYILSKREHDSQYPVYITDLDLSPAIDTISQLGRLQIVHYLRIKNRLEAQLNQAIGILLNA